MSDSRPGWVHPVGMTNHAARKRRAAKAMGDWAPSSVLLTPPQSGARL